MMYSRGAQLSVAVTLAALAVLISNPATVLRADATRPAALPPAMTPATRPSRADVAAAVQKLSAKLPADRQAAADTLRRMGVDAASAQSALSAAVADDSPAVQVAAAEAWVATFGKGPDAISSLLKALKDDRELIRVAAAGRLAVIAAADAARVVDALLPLLEDPKSTVRGRAATSIGLLAENAPEQAARAVEPLKRLLTDVRDNQAWEPRFDAARALLRIGPGAKSSLPALSAALRSTDSIPYLRDKLIPLLPRVAATPAELASLLTELKRDPDKEVAAAAEKLAASLESPGVSPK